jgi:hypothetical protein
MLFDGGDDASCKSTCAMLLVSGDFIENDEFTHLFGMIPTEAGKAGDCSCWRVSSESQVQSTNLERHIHRMLDQIKGKEHVIKHLKKERNCQVDLGCEWRGHAQSNDTGPFLTPETLRRVADFDLNLIFYFQR